MLPEVPFPPDLVARYRREGYWRGERLGALIDHWVGTTPDRVAVVDAAGRWTYAAIDGRAWRLAAGLAELGMGRDSRVVVQLPNIAEFVVVCLALFRIGAVPVFSLPGHRRAEVSYLCRAAGASAYILARSHQGFDYLPMARAVRHEVPGLRHVIVHGDAGEFTCLSDVAAPLRQFAGPDPGDIAFFLLSGGTTGLPKLIPRTHDDYAYQLRATAAGLWCDERTTYLAVVPAATQRSARLPGGAGHAAGRGQGGPARQCQPGRRDTADRLRTGHPQHAHAAPGAAVAGECGPVRGGLLRLHRRRSAAPASRRSWHTGCCTNWGRG